MWVLRALPLCWISSHLDNRWSAVRDITANWLLALLHTIAVLHLNPLSPLFYKCLQRWFYSTNCLALCIGFIAELDRQMLQFTVVQSLHLSSSHVTSSLGCCGVIGEQMLICHCKHQELQLMRSGHWTDLFSNFFATDMFKTSIKC